MRNEAFFLWMAFEKGDQSARSKLQELEGKAKLDAKSLAIAHYKQAINLGETLPAGNLAHLLIDTGELEEAEKILDAAKTQKNVHKSVNQALVKLHVKREEDQETKTKSLEYARQFRDFLVDFADASIHGKGKQLQLGGAWCGEKKEAVEFKLSVDSTSLEIVWGEVAAPTLLGGSTIDRYRLLGSINGFGLQGNVEVWKADWALLGSKPDAGKWEHFGPGYAFFSKDGNQFSAFFTQKDTQNASRFSAKRT